MKLENIEASNKHLYNAATQEILHLHVCAFYHKISYHEFNVLYVYIYRNLFHKLVSLRIIDWYEYLLNYCILLGSQCQCQLEVAYLKEVVTTVVCMSAYMYMYVSSTATKPYVPHLPARRSLKGIVLGMQALSCSLLTVPTRVNVR